MFCKKCGNQIDENAKFCPNCGYNLGNTEETVITHSIEKETKKKKTNICSILSIIFASIGIVPLLNILFVPIATILAIIGLATGKNTREKIKIVSVIMVIISIIVSLLWMIPAINGSPTGDNGGNSNFCSHSYSLKETEATCLSGGYATYQCNLCDATKREYESALGHSWINNRCERCGVTKDLELDPIDNNILTIEQIDWDINSADGVEPEITYTNHSGKQIAYLYFTLKFYDRMGNPAYCSIRDTHTRRLKVTGPIDSGIKDTSYWDPTIYNNSTAAIKPLKIEIEFTDGTEQTIICTGRFWYTKSYYGGELHD